MVQYIFWRRETEDRRREAVDGSTDNSYGNMEAVGALVKWCRKIVKYHCLNSFTP